MNEHRVIKHDRALRDLEHRSDYIHQHNLRAALRFLGAAEATIRRLAGSPGIGTRYDPDHPALADLRFFPISGFKNDLVFYRSLADGIEVLRVLHGAQDIHRILAEEFGIEENADDGQAENETDDPPG
jgi:toxin ParE1/3/4